MRGIHVATRDHAGSTSKSSGRSRSSVSAHCCTYAVLWKSSQYPASPRLERVHLSEDPAMSASPTFAGSVSLSGMSRPILFASLVPVMLRRAPFWTRSPPPSLTDDS